LIGVPPLVSRDLQMAFRHNKEPFLLKKDECDPRHTNLLICSVEEGEAQRWISLRSKVNSHPSWIGFLDLIEECFGIQWTSQFHLISFFPANANPPRPTPCNRGLVGPCGSRRLFFVVGGVFLASPLAISMSAPGLHHGPVVWCSMSHPRVDSKGAAENWGQFARNTPPS